MISNICFVGFECSYVAIRITTGRARFYNQKWPHANSHQVGSKSLKSFFVLRQGWNFFLFFSFGQEGGCQKILHDVKGYEKLWPFQKYALPPPPSFWCIHNGRSLTSNFFSCHLGHFFFYLLYSFLRFMRDCKHTYSFGNPGQRITERGLSWDCLSRLR